MCKLKKEKETKKEKEKEKEKISGLLKEILLEIKEQWALKKYYKAQINNIKTIFYIKQNVKNMFYNCNIW